MNETQTTSPEQKTEEHKQETDQTSRKQEKKKDWIRPISFETHPDEYRHIDLDVQDDIAYLEWNTQEDGGLGEYKLKMNSYDMSVDVELADAVNRLRFEHPEVGAVVITSGVEGSFSGGANIFMLESSHHGFKVNFCKFTNETRLAMEDASEHSGQTYIAGLNGATAGGGYELALACDEIYLVDDRQSAVSLPEVPLLGVLPGTGGLTRLVDKRNVRRDIADRFCTTAEGAKGEKAVEWDLVDGVFPKSDFDEEIEKRARECVREDRSNRTGVDLDRLEFEKSEERLEYEHVTVAFDHDRRTAALTVQGPDSVPELPEDPATLGADWYPLQMYRELDNALCRLRFNHPKIGVVEVRTEGDVETVRELDQQLVENDDHWFVNEVIQLAKRTLKRMDYTSKSFLALVEEGSCFAGQLLELALASDQVFMLDHEDVRVGLSSINDGYLPMGNGQSRLQTRFPGDREHAEELAGRRDLLDAADAEEAGLATETMEDLFWEDEIRLVVEERASISPDGLTGMEANLRFPGPETMETKIFGRLSAFQNWIFRGDNAVGERGALTTYRSPESTEFDWKRT